MVRRYFNSLCIILLILSVGTFNLRTDALASSESDKTVVPVDKAAIIVDDEKDAVFYTPERTPPAPQKETTSSTGKTLLYVGAGVAVIAGVALAVSSGGSSSTSTPVVKDTPVGADLDGKSWYGYLTLVDGYKEPVTATVTQNGADLEITTSTTQEYGKKFVGTISKAAFIKVEDQTTGETWSTQFGNASWNKIVIYDYVHLYSALDRLALARDSKL